ncbi:hypothetical protein, variant [Blastomyces dermatitidis ATCC 26199]|nr:hypothetical protein BDFG_04819 [Blastomyces dermatitidis ATCC 26199]EQL33073.1 hypothetical protein, variant [Blastomyces dermatitidis ATCC 26199]
MFSTSVEISELIIKLSLLLFFIINPVLTFCTPLSLPSTSGDGMEERTSGHPDCHTNSEICLEIRKMPENTKLYLQVSSDTLCEAPNRFDRANSTPLGRKVSNGLSRILAPGEKVCVIQLFDDDANALILLFRVLHHKIQAIPTKRTPSQLLDLAVVADKYCCEKPLFPFTRRMAPGAS